MFSPENVLVSKISATYEKLVLHAFVMASGLVDILTFIFIVDILLYDLYY